MGRSMRRSDHPSAAAPIQARSSSPVPCCRSCRQCSGRPAVLQVVHRGAPRPRLPHRPQPAAGDRGSLSTVRRIPYCLSQRRRRPSLPLQGLVPLIICAIERHPDSNIRDSLAHTLFNLIKRLDGQQRRIITDVEELWFKFVHDPYGVVVDVALRELVPAVVGWVGKLDQILEVVLSHILASAQPAAWHTSLRHH